MKTKAKRISFIRQSEKAYYKRWSKVASKKRRGKVFKHGKLVNSYKNGKLFYMQDRKKRRKNPNSRKNLIKPEHKIDNSLFALLERIPDEQTCIKWFEKIRLELNIGCPYCGHEKFTTFIVKKTGIKKYNCCKCRKPYALTQGTVFENTKLPFRKWFLAIYLNANSSKGISSYHAARILGVTQKTAWTMMQKVRKMYKSYIDGVKMTGVVEVDETYLGTRQPVEKGKRRPSGYATQRGSIFGMLQRDGEIYVQPLPDTRAETLEGIIDSVIVDPSNTKIMSDQLAGYDNLKNKYEHGRVVHRREFAKPGGITTNGIESFWSILKKSEYGVYHMRYGHKHVDLYAAEIAYLSSKRNAQSEDRISDVLRLCTGNLTWDDLKNKKPVKNFPDPK
jgi:transposase-like protein